MKPRLGLNIDHIATLRQARRVRYPDPFDALDLLKKCRVDQVTLHLREDRRHIVDDDLRRIIAAKKLPVNLEMAVTDEMVKIALKTKPHTVTLVPEKREEITTEGGLDVIKNQKRIDRAVSRLKSNGIRVSLFVDPSENQIRMSQHVGADAVEIHTGCYCDLMESYFLQNKKYPAKNLKKWPNEMRKALESIAHAAALANSSGLAVFAGHGLHTQNLEPIVRIREIEEYNIGHAVIARAVFVGLVQAVREIQAVLRK